MSIEVSLHPSLQRFANNQSVIRVAEGLTATQLLSTLGDAYPTLKPYLFNSTGDLSQFINVYINGEDVRYQMAESHVNGGDHVDILTSLAGG